MTLSGWAPEFLYVIADAGLDARLQGIFEEHEACRDVEAAAGPRSTRSNFRAWGRMLWVKMFEVCRPGAVEMRRWIDGQSGRAAGGFRVIRYEYGNGNGWPIGSADKGRGSGSRVGKTFHRAREQDSHRSLRRWDAPRTTPGTRRRSPADTASWPHLTRDLPWRHSWISHTLPPGRARLQDTPFAAALAGTRHLSRLIAWPFVPVHVIGRPRDVLLQG